MLTLVLDTKFVVILATELCLNLWDPMDCRLPGSSVQAGILEWVAILSSGGSSRPGDGTCVS